MLASSVLSFCSPRFQPGRLLMTPGVTKLVHDHKLNLMKYLSRHLECDWGDVSENDRQANQEALREGDQLLSAYQVSPDLRLLIITDAGRAVTTAALPGER